MPKFSNVYISSSWKNREQVREVASRLRAEGFTPYDFTDPSCRTTPEIPPEKFSENFDPDKHEYSEYIRSVPEWKQAVKANQIALRDCDAVLLLLPCGNDAHADAYYALGLGKHLVVCGQPVKGDRTPTHLWADAVVPFAEDAVWYLATYRKNFSSHICNIPGWR